MMKSRLASSALICKIVFITLPIGTFQDFKTEVRELDRIDYIFTKGFDILTHAHLDDRRKSDPSRYPSDHFPVLVELDSQE